MAVYIFSALLITFICGQCKIVETINLIPMKQIKAYVGGHLIKSKKFSSSNTLADLLQDLHVLKPSAAYLCEFGKSSKLSLSNGSQSRPIRYTRSNGDVTYTLPINPKLYPVIAHFADSSSKTISL